MRVLLSAFACDPQFGSDEEVGWQWACALAQAGHEVTVLTRASHRAAIEAAVAAGAAAGVRFVYVDAPRVHALLARVNRRNHLYYYLWQWLALRRARALLAAQPERPFERVHHVTWVSFRQPSFMGALGIPFVFGPVAGGDEIPRGYARRFSPKQRLVETVRVLLNRLVRYDPLMRRTFRQAQQLLFTSPAHLALVPPFAAAKARIELAIASHPDAPPHRQPGDGTRLLFAGRALGLKGMDIGLQVFALALRERPALRLSIVGDGPELARWQALAGQLGVAHAVQWLGWLPKAQVQALYASYDALLYPSLRDSGGFVVLEALQAGLPVVCFRLGGPGVMVDDSVGAAIAPGADLDTTVRAYALRLLEVLDRALRDPALAAACRERAARYSWAALVRRLYGPEPQEAAR